MGFKPNGHIGAASHWVSNPTDTQGPAGHGVGWPLGFKPNGHMGICSPLGFRPNEHMGIGWALGVKVGCYWVSNPMINDAHRLAIGFQTQWTDDSHLVIGILHGNVGLCLPIRFKPDEHRLAGWSMGVASH